MTWTADSTGAVNSTVRYDPWGSVAQSWTATGVSLPDWRFQGSWRDSSVDLYWVVARWYAPTLGRFISEDTLLGEESRPASRHLYAYVYGNPSTYTDVMGTCSWSYCCEGSPAAQTSLMHLAVVLPDCSGGGAGSGWGRGLGGASGGVRGIYEEVPGGSINNRVPLERVDSIIKRDPATGWRLGSPSRRGTLRVWVNGRTGEGVRVSTDNSGRYMRIQNTNGRYLDDRGNVGGYTSYATHIRVPPSRAR